MANFIDGLESHHVLDDGKLVVAHAGLREEMHGRVSGRVRDVAVHGEKTGATDQYGNFRYKWAVDYHGEALVVYGHTPVAEPLWLNNTVNIDTGCVFGGSLSALPILRARSSLYPHGRCTSRQLDLSCLTIRAFNRFSDVLG